MFGRVAVFVYGVVCYLVFLTSFVYAVGFLGDVGVPKSIDSGPTGSIGAALAVDGGLLLLFAAQHSVMARPWFKRAWTRVVPPAAERSTYVLFSSLALILLFWAWRPIGGVVWSADHPAVVWPSRLIYGAGWGLLLVSTFLIDHFDLFGLRQSWGALVGRPAASPEFRAPGLYRHVRHPIYLSWLCIFWATPRMTSAHLFFAAVATAYILVAVRWEERDLIRAHGDDYRRYREETPMLIPLGGLARKGRTASWRRASS